MKYGHGLRCLGTLLVTICLCLAAALPAQAADYDWTTITETAILIPDNQTPGQQFGYPVAISGDTALVTSHDNVGSGSAVYVFTRSGTTWSQQAVLTPSVPEAAMGFGSAIAFNGDTALIGGPFNTETGHNGRVYVFTRSGTTWSQQAILMPSDSSLGDYFGTSIALDGETALIGADGIDAGKGAAYIFTGSGNTWNERFKLTADDGAANDAFGITVDLEGTTAAIGAYKKDNATGAVYIFTGSGDTWSQPATLTANDAAEGENFGITVAYSDDTILIGQGLFTSTGQYVYFFTRSGTNWSQQAKLSGSHRTINDMFGLVMDYQDDVALIGAPFYDNLTGSVYVFTRGGTSWSEQNWWLSSDPVEWAGFGVGLARSGNTILVGSPSVDTEMGMVYVYNVEEAEEARLPRGVGGEVSAVNRAGVILPGLGLILLFLAAGVLFWSRRSKA